MPRALILSAIALLAFASITFAQEAPVAIDDCESLDTSQKIWQFTNITPELSDEHVTGGKHSLKLAFAKDGALEKSFKNNPQDWSHYKSIEFDVFNPTDQRVTLVVRIDDGDHPYKDRFERADSLYLPPNKLVHVEMDITNMLANDGRLVDTTHITNMVIHAGGDPKTLYFDSFQFIPLAEKDWPAKPVNPATEPKVIDDAKNAAFSATLWKGSLSKIENSTDNAVEGYGSLKVTVSHNGGNLKMDAVDHPMDWRAYRSLKFSVFNAMDKNMVGTVYIDDATTISPDNRFTVDDIALPAGKSKDININIDRMVSRCGLKMDMSKIAILKIDFHAAGEAAANSPAAENNDAPDMTVFVSGLRLEGDKGSLRNELLPGRIPGQTPASLAQSLLSDPEIKPLLPIFKAMGKKKFAICSHSASMSTHWSTSGSFFDIACEVVKSQDPDFEYCGPTLYHAGGMGAPRAVTEFLKPMEEYKPTDVYFLVVPEPISAEKQLVQGMKSVGSRVFIFDGIKAWGGYSPAETTAIQKLCDDENATFVQLMARGWGVPGSYDWCSVDGIHMKTAGHIFYAKELLKEWAKIYAPQAPQADQK